MQQAITHIDYKNLCEQLQVENAFLKQELAQLKKIIFGSKQERFVAGDTVDPKQLSLSIQAEAVAAVKITEAKRLNTQKLPKKSLLPDYIPAAIHCPVI